MNDAASTETKSIDLLALLAEVEDDMAYMHKNGIVCVMKVRSSAKACKARLESVAVRRKLSNRCGRCGGSGHLQEFYYVAGGVCFDCNGWGIRGGHI